MFDLSLRDQEPVEWIAVMGGQACDLSSVGMKNGKSRDRLTLEDLEQGIAINR